MINNSYFEKGQLDLAVNAIDNEGYQQLLNETIVNYFLILHFLRQSQSWTTQQN